MTTTSHDGAEAGLSAETPEFRDLPSRAVVETDRFCAGCGYNLRQQAVRRETHTRLLLAQCPECGAFEPVSRDTTVTRLWMAWAVRLFLVLWVAVLLLLMWIAGCAIYACSYEFAQRAQKILDEWQFRGYCQQRERLGTHA